MNGRALPAPAGRDAAGLFPEANDYPVERGRARVRPRKVRRGRSLVLEVEHIAPEAELGPVDLTVYGPRGTRTTNRPASYPLDPDYYEVVVEATLTVRRGRARFRFRTTRHDHPGRYVAVFRRTDFSSRPVARRSFEVVR